ncbi:MAG: ABC transporter permease subunit [Myxococcales bacterium]|jgi:hypothetical protein
MIPLLRKELRALLPWALLALCVMALSDLVYMPLTARFDEIAWTSWNEDLLPGKGGGHAGVLLVLGLMLSYSLFPREHDDGTIALLHALPVSRRTIFLAKSAAAFLVLATAIVSGHVVGWLLQLPNTQSFTGEQFRLSVAAGVAGLEISVAAIVLAHGLLASFLRKFGLVAYLALAWLVTTLGEEPGSPLALLDWSKLLALEYQGRDLVIPWRELALHLGIGALAWALAFALWSGAAERFTQVYLSASSRLPGKIALAIGTLALFGVGAGFAISTFEREEYGSVRFVEVAPARASTEHFQFTYFVGEREPALRLVAEAEEHFRAVQQALGMDSGPKRVEVDLTGASRGTAGTAVLQRVRVHLGDAPESVRHTFRHELAHVFSFEASNRALVEKMPSSRFFSEGLAERVAFELGGDPEALRASRRAAAAAWKRYRISFEQLCDEKELERRYDRNHVYALGEVFVAALVESAGRDAPLRLLDALGREDAPKDLEADELWRDTFQAAGLDLEAAIAAWEKMLETLYESDQPFFDALPRLGGGVCGITDDDEVLLFARPDRPSPFVVEDYRLRVRSGPGEDDEALVTYRPAGTSDGEECAGVVFYVPRDALRGRRFELQFGLQLAPSTWPLYEPWQSAAIPER